MKLKFELKKVNIDNLCKLLQMTSQIWKNDEKIYFYFDADQMIIYPENRSGFDKIFARIHINNTHSKAMEVSIITIKFSDYLIDNSFHQSHRAKTSSHHTKSNRRKRSVRF